VNSLLKISTTWRNDEQTRGKSQPDSKGHFDGNCGGIFIVSPTKLSETIKSIKSSTKEKKTVWS
jgi:hypothetical protein